MTTYSDSGTTDFSPVVCLAERAGCGEFSRPIRVVEAGRVEDVVAVLDEVEREAAAGRTCVGFVSYEAAAAFDAALGVHALTEFPLAWFAIFEGDGTQRRPTPALVAPPLSWAPALRSDHYSDAIGRIREWIAAGDTYQVNFTYPTHAAFRGDAWGLFASLFRAQPTDLGMYLDLGRYAVASVSPELFFELDGDRIVTRPMKGTARRGLSSAEDDAQAVALRASDKERAENIMIVDMIRNDLGRIARTGTVSVASLFDVERHPTVWQMTSTVEARTDAALAEVFRALFPSASVTGAPKVRTMEIIRELEPGARGVYCGALGTVGPGRRARFSVGIRTATVDRAAGTATYHVGSGITWDSVAAAEQDECRAKANVLTHRRRQFQLLESLLWDGGYYLLDAHLERLRASAAYFDFAMDDERVRRELEQCASALRAASKVRLLLGRGGEVSVEAGPATVNRPVTVALAREPVDSGDVFLYHKTTRREAYSGALASVPGVDDAILWNERGEVTESTTANVLVRRGGEWITPPVSSGLLAGVMRGELLREGRIREARVTLAEFAAADEIALVNSVRRWIPVAHVAGAAGPAAATA